MLSSTPERLWYFDSIVITNIESSDRFTNSVTTNLEIFQRKSVCVIQNNVLLINVS